jgi:hypothetical protein
LYDAFHSIASRTHRSSVALQECAFDGKRIRAWRCALSRSLIAYDTGEGLDRIFKKCPEIRAFLNRASAPCDAFAQETK